jgi:hypothetical protein
MSRANYFYIIAYPEYSGFRVEHDPTFTAYIAANQDTNLPPTGASGIIIVAIVIIAVGVGIAVFIARRKPKPPLS